MRENYFRLSARLQVKHQIQAVNMHALVFFVATLFIAGSPFSLFAQTPSISYSNNHTYNTGAPITPLVPTISGMPAGSHNVATVSLSFGFHNPLGVTVDAAGNVYVADNENHQVKKIPPGEITPQIIGSGFRFPAGVAVDAIGNVYVADYGNNAVKKIPAAGGAPITLGSGFSGPTGVAVDAKGNVYVADRSNYAIKKIPVGGGAPVAIGTNFNYPAGVAVDPQGNVYVADYCNNAVKEILVNGGSTITLGSGFIHPNSVALDATGNVYVTDEANNAVKMIPAGGGTPVSIGSGFNTPFGVAVDAAGNIYTGDAGNNAVKKIKPVIGYYVTPALPAGLILDNTTGMISGTPIAGSPATTYTITAHNSSGSSVAKVNITVIFHPPAAISYGNPKVYTLGTAIASLAPVINGFEASGYSIVPILPTGLNFDTATGIISGTPTVVSPETNYTITANAGTGNNSALVIISVVSPLLPPNISYNVPGNYTIGVPIPALAPAGNTAVTQGYIIIPALPAGLSFDNVTGIISGTPTQAQPSTTYYITAYNTSGRNTTKVVITITDPSTHPSPVTGPPTTHLLPPVTDPSSATDPGGFNTVKGVGGPTEIETVPPPTLDISEPVVRQAVSPNGDGINDVLTIDNIQSYPDNKLTLMNRSGAEVFQITGYDNVSKVFDGHSNINHVLQQPGTYFYLLEYKVNGAVKRKTGFLILKY